MLVNLQKECFFSFKTAAKEGRNRGILTIVSIDDRIKALLNRNIFQDAHEISAPLHVSILVNSSLSAAAKIFKQNCTKFLFPLHVPTEI